MTGRPPARSPLPRASMRAGGVPAEPISRRKLSHEVLDRLLARIRSGEYPVGSLLPSERELMQAFGVGRVAVREALQSLERMGHVSIQHGEGARVLALSADSVLRQISDTALYLLSNSQDLVDNLQDARLILESAMVRYAAHHATADDIAELRRRIDEHKANAHDPQRFYETDMAFHRAITAVSRNPILIAVHQAMLQWLERFHLEGVRMPGIEQTSLREHVRIFECIETGDADGADKVISKHLTRVRRLYTTPPDPRP